MGTPGGSGTPGSLQRLPPEVNRILYVRNLPFNISAEELYKIFGDYGAIRQIRQCAHSVLDAAVPRCYHSKHFTNGRMLAALCMLFCCANLTSQRQLWGHCHAPRCLTGSCAFAHNLQAPKSLWQHVHGTAAS